ncbi:MAG TPA: hypothetical protein VKT77_12590 [Chthonomonadaceae bacterium]|nr:hypothetical protein [Chthonomonadaceae bacterium]
MNKRLLALAGLATVIGLGATYAVSAQTPGPTFEPMAQRERHPEMRAALQALRNAKGRLESAAHDYEGHRVKALEHTNAAIREVELALKSDRH